MADKLAVMACEPRDYARLGLSPTSIAQWEDGARTDASAGTYEWWYFDAHLADGAKLVVSFMDKGDIADPKGPLSPVLRLNLDLPDGRHFDKLVHYPPDQWSAAKDHADVRLGDNRFSGDLHTYRIHATADEVSVDVTLTGEVPPWRPSTGYMLFGADRALEVAWLPAVPQGAVAVKYSIDGEQHDTTGVGYHDHNWGNVGLMKVVHDWYWARGQAGPYSVIASYTYRDGEDRYLVAFTRTHDLSVDRMIDTVKGVKRVAAKAGHARDDCGMAAGEPPAQQL
jgi:predicted secreted hydrolase